LAPGTDKVCAADIGIDKNIDFDQRHRDLRLFAQPKNQPDKRVILALD
jgi:hypothetical protein